MGSLAFAHLGDLVLSALRLARGRRRHRTRVTSEYDQGVWKALLEERRWEQADDLTDFVLGRDEGLILGKLGGRAVRIVRREYYRLRMQALQALMAAYAGEAEPLVELGSGFGYNLFSLAAGGRWTALLGLDISANAIAAGRLIADHFKQPGIQFDLIDITERDDPGFAAVRDRVVFTYFCIEQVPRVVPEVVANLLAAGPRRVVHIESAAEFLDPLHLGDWANYLYVRSVDYQRTLRTTLRALAARGVIRICEERRLDWAPTIHNDGSIIVWEPDRTPAASRW
jgi:hypothetical protein